jgi:ribosomal-protein-alanine N-acetyltransferase
MFERTRLRVARLVGSPGAGRAGAQEAGSATDWSWPVRLSGRTAKGLEVVLRPLTTADATAFQAVRRANAAWLEPWDATSPDPDAPGRTFEELVEQYDRDARAGRALPFAVEVEGRFVGQLTVGSIVLGSFRSCYVGYWVSRSVAGRSVIPTALALAGDHALGALGLHRIEVNIRPENTASLAVVRKLGFRSEGLRLNYLHIAGAWRDHLSFALTTEDLAGETLVDRLARLASVAAGEPLRSTGDATPQASHESPARHTEGGPASGDDAHLTS